LATFVLMVAIFYLKMYEMPPSWLQISWLQKLLMTR
jgi:hypothetical protein